MISFANFYKGIVVIPTQGLGNRLRMLACTYALCNKLNLDMYVNWNPAPECNAFLDDLFAKNSFKTINNEQLNKYVYLFHGHVHTEQFINNLHNIPNKYDFLVITGGHEFKLKDMSPNEFMYYKHDFYSNLKFSEVVNAELSNYSNSLLNINYIGLHFRGIQQAYDTADINNPVFNNKPYNPVNFTINSPLTEFLDIIKNIKSNLPILVITNTPDIINIIKDKYPDKNILNTFPSKFDRNSNDSIISSFVDFILLSRSKLIIGTYYSSFSDEATFSNLIPKITPVSNYIKSNPKLVESYHSYNYGIYSVNNYLYFGLNLTNYHMIKYFKYL